MKRSLLVSLVLLSGVLLVACGKKSEENIEIGDNSVNNLEVKNLEENNDESVVRERVKVNYLVLVNKENKIPDDWEDNMDLRKTRNVYGNEINIDRKTFKEFRKLKKVLMEEGIDIELYSAYRSEEKQQEIWNYLIEEKGEDYVKQNEEVPGYSEHQTSLAVDIVINKDGGIIGENDAMLAETEIFEKIHEKLADYGFILRYPEGKEDITGYPYKPRHLRYVGDMHVAREIYENGWTLEEYLKNLEKVMN